MNLLQRVRYQLFDKPLVDLVQPYTLVGTGRIGNLKALAKRIESDGIPGDVIECGVCNGGTAAVLAMSASRSRMNRTVWLLDSFQGMPPVTPEDTDGPGGDKAAAHVGKEVGDPERVREILMKVGADMGRVRILPGWFHDTFPSVTASQIAILNIDADWYESVKLCLHTFFDRVAQGGFINFDDYGHWPGCKRATDEFFESRNLSYKLV